MDEEETCIECGVDMQGDEFFCDICDECADDQGLDGPWDDDE